MKLSVVIPVYNEAERLPKALAICHRATSNNPDWEFIFVNDGSTDRSETIIKASGFNLISYQKNRGKGYALKEGVKKAKKPLILTADVDFSTPLTELPRLYLEMLRGADIVIGSRKIPGAKITKRQPFWRQWLGQQFTNLTNLWLGTSASDVTCGFKLFTRPAAKKLFSRSRINRWGYDAEILFLAKKLKLKVREVPVIWRNDERTKVSLARDILRSLYDLFLIRWNNLKV